MNPSRLFYHVTPRANLPAILREGLKPQCGPRSALCGETAPAVFVFCNQTALDDALTNWLGEAFDEDEALVILEIDAEGLFMQNSSAAYERLVITPIPPNRILSARNEAGRVLWAPQDRSAETEPSL